MGSGSSKKKSDSNVADLNGYYRRVSSIVGQLNEKPKQKADQNKQGPQGQDQPNYEDILSGKMDGNEDYGLNISDNNNGIPVTA